MFTNSLGIIQWITYQDFIVPILLRSFLMTSQNGVASSLKVICKVWLVVVLYRKQV